MGMFVNTYHGSSDLVICHIIWALVFREYMCPNIGILAICPTFCVLEGSKC